MKTLAVIVLISIFYVTAPGQDKKFALQGNVGGELILSNEYFKDYYKSSGNFSGSFLYRVNGKLFFGLNACFSKHNLETTKYINDKYTGNNFGLFLSGGDINFSYFRFMALCNFIEKEKFVAFGNLKTGLAAVKRESLLAYAEQEISENSFCAEIGAGCSFLPNESFGINLLVGYNLVYLKEIDNNSLGTLFINSGFTIFF